ncbi:immunoglobulin kappa light chain-like isoform 6-T6 [Pangshura tecta]
MLLLQVLIVTSTWSYGSSQITLTQTPLSVTRAGTKSASIWCKISGGSFNFNDDYIHWYRQSPGAAPKRILYIRGEIVSTDEGFDSKKFKADNYVSASTSKLTVHNVASEDAATYYCAIWDRTYGVKYFGSGTKLVVSNIKAKFNSTTMKILPPSTEQDGKVSYMCLIQDFYPNVIKVTWEDENKNEEKNGVHEEIWIHRDNESYSLSSWLTVDKNSGKNYSCKYQHEIQNNYVPVESPDKPVVTQTTGSCISKPENGTTLSTDTTDSFTHRTASLIYIVLLLKSTMYYVIVLFFIYRMQSPIKRRGKKP